MFWHGRGEVKQSTLGNSVLIQTHNGDITNRNSGSYFHGIIKIKFH